MKEFNNRCCQLFLLVLPEDFCAVGSVSREHGSLFVSGIKLLLIVCFPHHRSREEYPSGHAGGICLIFSLNKGIESILIRDDEREGEKVWDVLSVCLCAICEENNFGHYLMSIQAWKIEEWQGPVSFSLLNVTVLQADGLESHQYQKAILNFVNWERTDGCCFVDKTEASSVVRGTES